MDYWFDSRRSQCCGGGIGKRSYQSGGDSSGRATASLRTALIVTGDSLTVKNTTMQGAHPCPQHKWRFDSASMVEGCGSDGVMVRVHLICANEVRLANLMRTRPVYMVRHTLNCQRFHKSRHGITVFQQIANLSTLKGVRVRLTVSAEK